MELKPIKKIGTYALYKFKKFKELNNKLLARLHKELPEGATHAVLQFREGIENESKTTKSIAHKHNVALIYTASAAKIKAKKIALPETLKPGHMSADKVRALFIKQAAEARKKFKKLGPAFQKETAVAMGLLARSRHACLFKNGCVASLAIIVPREDYLGKKCDWFR